MDLILMLVVFGAVFYFLLIRPQQKRLKDHQAMVSAIEPGARVLLTSGVFATVRHVGERQMIVELTPGVEVTVVKGHVSKVVTPDEEEFEFEEDGVADDISGAYAEDTAADGYPSDIDDPLNDTLDAPSDTPPAADETNR